MFSVDPSSTYAPGGEGGEGGEEGGFWLQVKVAKPTVSN